MTTSSPREGSPVILDVDPLALDLTPKGTVKGATAGSPEHASAVIASQDGMRVGTWRCEPGEFPWEWKAAEMFHIIEGEGTVTDEDGTVHELAPGRVFFMAAGSRAWWKVTRTIRKSYAVAVAEVVGQHEVPSAESQAGRIDSLEA